MPTLAGRGETSGHCPYRPKLKSLLSLHAYTFATIQNPASTLIGRRGDFLFQISEGTPNGQRPEPMTGAELDDLVATLRQSTSLSRLTPGGARAVFLQLLAKGYDLTKSAAGGKFIESDIEKHELIRWLQDKTPLGALSYPEASSVFNSLGYRIQKPAKHPSGLATTEQAHTDVKPFGAFAGSRNVISKGAPIGPASTFNGGES
jgi:hypothetical protein